MIYQHKKINAYPTASIAVITYNQQSTIRQAIDSILSQKCNFPFEIIIGEDCSTDNTRDICIEYQEKYPALIKLKLQENNQGLIKNYADVMSLCTGKYIAFCAGDDFWCDDFKLQKQVDFLESHDGYGVVRSAHYILNHKTGRLLTGTWHSIVEGSVFDIAKYGPVAAAATICFKNELLKYIDFNQFINRRFSIEDYPMQAILAKYTKFGYIPDITAVFRRWKGSGSYPENRAKSLTYYEGYAAAKRYLSELYPHDIEFNENMERNFIFHKKLRFAFEDFDYKRAFEIANKMINPNKKEQRLIKFTKNKLVFYFGCFYKKFKNLTLKIKLHDFTWQELIP